MTIQREHPTSGPLPALGFSTLESEVTVEELPLQGEIPAWLSGSLLRTGPAKFEVGEDSLRHWFDGLAMLHRFTIADGSVSYGNRFLNSRSYRAARDEGKLAYREFASDPCRKLFRRVHSMFSGSEITDNASVSIARLGERFIAMTEGPIPVEFDADTLEAAGVTPYRAPGQISTAHPHVDRSDGAIINYASKLGASSSYRIFSVGPDGAPTRKLCSLPTREPSYMHSFGLTERWVVLAEYPLVVNPVSLALSGRPFIENFRWKPERGTRFTLVDRSSGEAVSGFRSEPCFAFHHVNSYEDGDEVLVDICAYPDASIVQSLYLDHLRAGGPVPAGTLTRFHLRPSDGSVTRETLCEAPIELPRISYERCNERPYHHVWGVGVGASGWIDEILKVELRDGSTLGWRNEGCFPGEPVFVPRPGAYHEDDGVLLSVVLDAGTQRSFLLVLDAADLFEVARAELPHHVPFGFHGHFDAGA